MTTPMVSGSTAHTAIDLGSLNQPAVQHGGPVALTQSASYRALIRDARAFQARGMDPCLALNRLRPCADSPNAQIAANATLRKDEWIQFDEAVVPAFQEVVNGLGDLLSRNLRINIGNPFGTTVLESEKISEMTAAHVSMYAGTPPEDDRAAYTLWGVPVPIISKGFWLDERVLEASRMRGAGLDTSNADAATRVVTEQLEALLFAGNVAYGGYTLTGYTNSPNVNTGTIVSWLTLATTAPMTIVQNVLTMMQALFSDNANGPYMLYVPNAWYVALQNSYFETTASSPAAVTGLVAPTQTIMQRIMAIPGIEDVKPTTQLTSGVVLVSLTRQTVDVGFGFEPRLIQWESQGGMVNHFRVISIMTFRVKSDYAGRSGVAYYSVAG